MSIPYERVDFNSNVRLSSLLLLTQQLSSDHSEMLGLGKEATFDKGMLWVIAKLSFVFHRLPKYGEEVIIRTWVNPSLYYFFPRFYEIEDKDGNIIVSGSSLWALIDKGTRKSIDPRAVSSNEGIEKNGREHPLNERIVPPELDKEAIIEAKYSYCDDNGHLNNACYVDFCQDLLGVEYLRSHCPKALHVTFKEEIPAGESRLVRYGKEGEAHYFSSDAFLMKIDY